MKVISCSYAALTRAPIKGRTKSAHKRCLSAHKLFSAACKLSLSSVKDHGEYQDQHSSAVLSPAMLSYAMHSSAMLSSDMLSPDKSSGTDCRGCLPGKRAALTWVRMAGALHLPVQHKDPAARCELQQLTQKSEPRLSSSEVCLRDLVFTNSATLCANPSRYNLSPVAVPAAVPVAVQATAPADRAICLWYLEIKEDRGTDSKA